MFSFLKKVTTDLDSYYLYIGKELRIYIPQKYFAKGIATYEGVTVKTLGIFVLENEGKAYKMTAPIEMSFEYSEQETAKNYKVTPKMPAIDYKVFILRDKDKFITKTKYAAKIQQTMDLLNYIFNGYLESDVDYSDVFSIIINSFSSSKRGLPATSSVTGAVIASLYRSKRDLYTPFRMVYDKENPYNYINVNIKRIPELTSAFSGLLGENINYQISNIIMRSKKGNVGVDNPIEELLIRQW